MKLFLRLSTFVLCFLMHAFSFSQTYKVDEKRLYNYDDFNDIWVQNITEQFAYANGGNKETSILGLAFPSGDNRYFYTKTYDANNNIMLSVRQNWNPTTMQWEDESRETYTYYAGTNNLKDVTTYSFSQGHDTFKIAYEYTGTDITKITLQDGSSGTLVNYQQYVYTYNTPGFPATEEDSEWNTSTNMWELKERGTATYTAGLREFITEKLNGSSWDLFERYLTYYTISIEKDDEHIQQSRAGASWVNTDRETSMYDANDNKTEYIFYSWLSNAWAPYYKEEQSFSVAAPFNLSTNDFSKTNFKVYPNPAADVINISSKLSIEKIQLFNVLGHKVLETSKTQQLNIESLSSGVYVLKVFNDNYSATRRILIQ